MDVTDVKWIVLSILFITTFVFSMLPLKLISKLQNTVDELQHARYSRIIGLLNCFAAGVFMGTALLDLFPEVKGGLKQAHIEKYSRSSFPVAEFTVSFGFLLVLIVEQLTMEFRERYSNREQPYDAECVDTVEQVELRTTNELRSHSTLRSFVLLLALSLHSLFEGLAIGLQPNINSIIQIFTAVILHKVIIAFSLGLNFVQTDLSVPSIIKSILWFSITSPIGIGIGTVVVEIGNSMNSSLVTGILQGLACGTFIYVTVFEILPHELGNSAHRLLKLLCLLLGFSVVCCVLFLDPTEPASCIKP